MAAPYNVRLDPDEARHFAKHGGTLLLLDVPEGTSFGIDQQMFVTGPRFRGVKMLPPGPHFVYYSAASKEGGAAPIIGFSVVLRQGQVVVRQWDAREDRLAPLNDEDQVERLAGGVKAFQFDAGLGAYDLHKYAAWQMLSGFITEEVVRAHEPVGGDICVVCEADIDEKRPKTGAELKLQEQIQRGRQRSGAAASDDIMLGSGEAEGGGRAEKGLDDVSQGVIIMDRGEEREAMAEGLGGPVERMNSARGSSEGLGAPQSGALGSQGLSKVDQIALMYQRKEARERDKAGEPAEHATAETGNGVENMDVDTAKGASQMQTELVGTSGGDRAQGDTSMQLEREDFAGLRGSHAAASLPSSTDVLESKQGKTRTAAIAPAGLKAQDPETGQSSVNRPAKTRALGKSPGQRETGAEPGPSSLGRAPGQNSGRCFYTDLPRLVKRPGMSPSELTALNLDKSGLLESVLSKKYKGREELLLGEMQFAFIAFVMGQSLESFAQWKAILHLALGCVEAPLRTHTRLFVQFLTALYWQLRQGLLSGPDRGVAGEALLDETWFQKDNFLQHLLTTFFSVLREAQPIDGELKKQADLLQSLLESSLGWRLGGTEEGSLSDEDDEYAPTIVY